jgi:hypothetical protein
MRIDAVFPPCQCEMRHLPWGYLSYKVGPAHGRNIEIVSHAGRLFRQLRPLMSYVSQLKRISRWQERINSTHPMSDLEYQDYAWAFFENCWHMKDWVSNDGALPDITRKNVNDDAHAPAILELSIIASASSRVRSTCTFGRSDPGQRGRFGSASVASSSTSKSTRLSPSNRTTVVRRVRVIAEHSHGPLKAGTNQQSFRSA